MTTQELAPAAGGLHEALAIGEVAVNRLDEMEKQAAAVKAQLAELAPSTAKLLVSLGLTPEAYEKTAADIFASDPVRTLKTLSNVLHKHAEVVQGSGSRGNPPRPLGRAETEKRAAEDRPMSEVDRKYFDGV